MGDKAPYRPGSSVNVKKSLDSMCQTGKGDNRLRGARMIQQNLTGVEASPDVLLQVRNYHIYRTLERVYHHICVIELA
jgi:hypothetical protein